MVKRSLKFLDPTNLRLDTINLTLISFTGGEETKFVIVELQRIEFDDNLRYNVSIEYIYISIYSETDEIRFPVVWEALKNNMSKLRAMRIKRRESGYWGLISVRFSRTGRVKPFSNERKEKEKNNAFGLRIQHRHEWWIESGNCASWSCYRSFFERD